MKDIFSSYKILNHIDYLECLVKNNKTYPIAVEIDLTNICNHNCVWCMFKSLKEKSPVNLDFDRLTKLLNELKEIGVKAITYVGGGEPLLYPKINEVLNLSKDLGFLVGIVTNGELLSDKINIIKDTCEFVRISLDAGSNRTHKRLHSPKSENSFNKILSNIEKIGRDKKKLILGVAFLIHPENYYEILKLANILSKLNVDYLQIRPVYFKGFSLSNEIINKVDEIVNDLEFKYRDKISIIFYKNRFNVINKYQKCLAHSLVSIINADGNIYLCCQLRGNDKFILGNLYKNSFSEIWNSENRQMVINKIDAQRCPPCRYQIYNQILNYLNTQRRHKWFI